MAAENGLKIIDISLRATNAERGHIMRYDAGVEEFLSLVKNAEYIVTNSFHGMIFSVQFRRPFVIFSREQCDNKIEELLELLNLSVKRDGKDHGGRGQHYGNVVAAYVVAFEANACNQQESDDKDIGDEQGVHEGILELLTDEYAYLEGY